MKWFVKFPNVPVIKRVIITAIALSIVIFFGLKFAQFWEWIINRFVAWA